MKNRLTQLFYVTHELQRSKNIVFLVLNIFILKLSAELSPNLLLSRGLGKNPLKVPRFYNE